MFSIRKYRKAMIMNRIKDFFKNKNNIKVILVYILLPIFINLIIEILSRSSVIDGIKYMFTHPVPFLCNAMIILSVLIFTILVRRRLFGLTVLSIIWIICGIVNMVLLNQRVTPFNASDLKLIDSAITIINKYFSSLMVAVVVVGVVLVVALVVFVFLKIPKVKYKINYVRNAIVVAAVIVLMLASINISIDTGFMSTEFTNLTTAYNEYGFVYCFMNGLVNTGVKKPSDYSQDTINEIVDKITTEPENTGEKKTPNIIFIQLESFFNLNNVKDIQLSENPIPYFTELCQKYSSGYLNVFNVGYGTCNTEFEVMTGMNLDDFGPGEFPYKTILKETTCENIAYDLKENGYATHAMHNNTGTFYGRNAVFKNLGYDTFTSIEYMHVNEFTPMSWAKDKFLTQEIIDTLKSTKEQDYIYTISVQGHGSYPTEPMYENPVIKVSGVDNEGQRNAIEYYANEIHEMDQFVKELVTALDELGEDTVLVMYGDHLPGLGFSDDELVNGSQYQTTYVIWDNIGLEKKDETLEAFQLSSEVMSRLNITTGVINQYHQKYRGTEEYLSGLQNLEYDILYGRKSVYGGINPYDPSDLKMGIKDIVINKVEKDEEADDGTVYVRGENFTEYSVVYVNGDEYDTEYIDENTLKIKCDKLKSLDSFIVSQKSGDTKLSSTKECLYYE